MPRLPTLKPRFGVLAAQPVRVLGVKAGTTPRIRGNAWMATRRRVLLRDGYTCQGCGLVRMDNEVDHRVPLEQGGTNDDDNLQTLCGGPDGCHTRKTAVEAAQRAKQW